MFAIHNRRSKLYGICISMDGDTVETTAVLLAVEVVVVGMVVGVEEGEEADTEESP